VEKLKSMDVIGVKGPNAGMTFPAIYELAADTLRVCYDLSGKKRPTEFKTSAGTKLLSRDLQTKVEVLTSFSLWERRSG
jgi:hypothetical protein